jgi:hypothetical protein
MIKYSFTRLNAKYHEDGTVTMTKSNVVEQIEIAADYLTGQKMFVDKDPIAGYMKTGYIGRGFTKRGIYVSLEYLKQMMSNSLTKGPLELTRGACSHSGRRRR